MITRGCPTSGFSRLRREMWEQARPLPHLVLIQTDPIQHTIILISQHIQKPIRPLPHIADARFQTCEQTLFMDHLVAVELQADQLLAGQCANEQVVLPRLEAVGVIKCHATDRR